MAHEVKLEVFEGPIDLLLHLITRQRVDIYEVSLATITEEYLDALDRMDGLDLESATGFLVIAATLLELKSSRLLPGTAVDDGDGGLLEERDLLLARLVECATYREAGAWLSAALARGEEYHGRVVALEPHLAGLVPDVLATTSVNDVAAAAAAALAPRSEVVLDVSHIAPIRASVRDAVVSLAARLEERGRATFEELCDRTSDRIEAVVRFLALLELYKAGAVELSQSGRFGAITAAWTGEATADDVVASAEEYVFDEEGAA